MFSSISDMLYTLFFNKLHQTEIGKKNQAKAKQYPEAELLLVYNYLFSFLSFAFFWFPKITGRILKKFAKNKCVYLNEIIWLIIIKVKKKNRSNRYVINRSTSRHRLTWTKYKKWFSMMMLIRINPIQDGGGGLAKRSSYQFFPCNIYKRRN